MSASATIYRDVLFTDTFLFPKFWSWSSIIIADRLFSLLSLIMAFSCFSSLDSFFVFWDFKETIALLNFAAQLIISFLESLQSLVEPSHDIFCVTFTLLIEVFATGASTSQLLDETITLASILSVFGVSVLQLFWDRQGTLVGITTLGRGGFRLIAGVWQLVLGISWENARNGTGQKTLQLQTTFTEITIGKMFFTYRSVISRCPCASRFIPLLWNNFQPLCSQFCFHRKLKKNLFFQDQYILICKTECSNTSYFLEKKIKLYH